MIMSWKLQCNVICHQNTVLSACIEQWNNDRTKRCLLIVFQVWIPELFLQVAPCFRLALLGFRGNFSNTTELSCASSLQWTFCWMFWAWLQVEYCGSQSSPCEQGLTFRMGKQFQGKDKFWTRLSPTLPGKAILKCWAVLSNAEQR